MLNFILRGIWLFSLMISFHYFHIKSTPQHHKIIQIYNIIQKHMKLYRKKKIAIIVTEHKGTIEENHSQNRDTKIGR